jgi:hypothetical protein
MESLCVDAEQPDRTVELLTSMLHDLDEPPRRR